MYFPHRCSFVTNAVKRLFDSPQNFNRCVQYLSDCLPKSAPIDPNIHTCDMKIDETAQSARFHETNELKVTSGSRASSAFTRGKMFRVL